MITNAERMEAIYENPYILITDQKISSLNDILPVLEKVAKSGKKELVIIADEVEGEALLTIVGGAGSKTEIEKRIKQIRLQIEQTTSDIDKEKLQERLAKLSGGVAVIKVGATTETELKEKKYRIE